MLRLYKDAFRSSHIIVLAVAIGFIAAGTPVAAAQKCDLVRVVVGGCEDITLPNEIRVKIGEKPVTLHRHEDGFYYATVDPFEPSDPKRILSHVDLPSVRTACHVPPKRDPAMQSEVTCRVLYEVPCESFWSLNVTAKKKGPSLAYHSQPRPPLIESCDPNDIAEDAEDHPLDPAWPLTIAPLARSQYLILGVQVPGRTPLKYKVDRDFFANRPNPVRLSQLRPLQDSTGQQVANVYMDDLKRKQAESMESMDIIVLSLLK